MKNIVKWYFDDIRSSIVPKPYSHQVTMPISIGKGESEGTALIPCTIYAMDHSIDLNPALIRKKDKKVMKNFEKGKNIEYNSNDYVVELTEDEKKKGYVLKELERCNNCGQKLVIAEVQATRYRSCPSINVRLADKAKEDVVVPVKFGLNKSSIHTRVVLTLFVVVASAIFTAQLFLGFSIPTITATIPKAVGIITVGLLLTVLWLWFIPRDIYSTFKTWQWYQSIKHSLVKNVYKE